MKKFFGFLTGLIVLLVAAVLIGPSFVNWNDYKDQIARQVAELTGRELTVNGDIRIAVLPAPALIAKTISFSNPDGASSRHMVTLKSAEVKVALGPLLSGQVKVETVRLIEPVIHLERLPDGSNNWEFTAQKPKQDESVATNESTTLSGADDGVASAIAVDNLQVVNATIVYRDSITGTSERIEKLTAEIAAASLRGPMEAKGSAILRNVPLTFALNMGEIIHGRTVPIAAQVGMRAGNLVAQSTGTLVDLANNPGFKGSVKIAGDDLAQTLNQLAFSLPEYMARPYGLDAEIAASKIDLEFQKLNLNFGSTRATGDLRLDFQDTVRFGGRVAVKKLDVEALLAAPPKQQPPKPTTDSTSAAANAPAKATAAMPDRADTQPEPLRFEVPTDIEGSVLFSVDAVDFQGDVIRDVLVNADLANGALSISQASAQLPGGADVNLSGRLSTPDKVPSFAGQIESTVSDTRGVLKWLDVELTEVPNDRLRKLSFQTKVAGTPEQVQLSEFDLRFDSSRLTGGVTVAIRQRPAFGANFVLDRLDLDAYLPNTGQGVGMKEASPDQQESQVAPSKTGSSAAARQKPSNPFSALTALTSFDANIKAHARTLVYGGTQIKDTVVDATLYNGNLEIRRLSVANLAGLSANVSGNLQALGAVPKAEGLVFDVSIRDVARLARFAGADLPVQAKKIGGIRVKGRAEGNLLRPGVRATLNAAGATLSVNGRVSALPLSDVLDAQVTLKHENAVRLLQRFGIAYRPAGKLGAISFDGAVKASGERVDVSNLRMTLGKLDLRGVANASLGGPKPKIVADLSAGAIAIDPLLPAKRRADLAPMSFKVLPAAWLPKPDPGGWRKLHPVATKPGRWSRDPIDLSFLKTFDADVSLKSPLIVFGKYLVEKADVAANVGGGILKTQRLNGTVFGGKMSARAELASGRRNAVQFALNTEGMDVARALKSVTGEATANGRMALNTNLQSSGNSVAELVASLRGDGAFNLTDVDVRNAGKGSMLSGLLGLFASLNSLGGGKTNDSGSVSATFKVAKGIARTADLKLASVYGNGSAAGSIDLPQWTIDLQGQVELAQNLLTQILRAKIRESGQAVPFAIQGALDAPNVKVDTGALLGAGVPIPGADALLNKAPKGVGNILRGILGGGAQPAPQQQPAAPPPPPSGGQPAPADSPPPPPTQQPQDVSPEQLLKKLFKL